LNYLRKFLQKDKKTLTNLAAVFAIGLLLLLSGRLLFNGPTSGFSLTDPGTAANTPAVNGRDAPRPGDNAASSSNGNAPANAESALESRLESVYSMIEGVGEVKVMLTLSDGRDMVVNDNGVTARAAGGAAGGATIEGVIIVAKGGGSEAIRNALIRSTQTILGVDAYKIQVLKMK